MLDVPFPGVYDPFSLTEIGLDPTAECAIPPPPPKMIKLK